jgi:hypothetical protein
MFIADDSLLQGLFQELLHTIWMSGSDQPINFRDLSKQSRQTGIVVSKDVSFGSH